MAATNSVRYYGHCDQLQGHLGEWEMIKLLQSAGYLLAGYSYYDSHLVFKARISNSSRIRKWLQTWQCGECQIKKEIPVCYHSNGNVVSRLYEAGKQAEAICQYGGLQAVSPSTAYVFGNVMGLDSAGGVAPMLSSTIRKPSRGNERCSFNLTSNALPSSVVDLVHPILIPNSYADAFAIHADLFFLRYDRFTLACHHVFLKLPSCILAAPTTYRHIRQSREGLSD